MKILGNLYGVDVLFNSDDEDLYKRALARLEYLDRMEQKFREMKTMQEANEFLIKK